MEIRPPPKGVGAAGEGSSRRWGRNYDNTELFPALECSDYETLLVKLAAIGVQPHRDDLDKRTFVVWHQLPDELVVRAESFHRDDWGSLSDDAPRSPSHQ